MKTYAERKSDLARMPRERLEAKILDEAYNKFAGQYADIASDSDADPRGHGKRIPYIGWYWRDVEFSDPNSIYIGHCGEFVGFMVKNKWDYQERRLTTEEASRVIGLLDEAMELDCRGGLLTEINARVYSKLDELWEYMQTLEV
jgi:hypothetical protein